MAKKWVWNLDKSDIRTSGFQTSTLRPFISKNKIKQFKLAKNVQFLAKFSSNKLKSGPLCPIYQSSKNLYGFQTLKINIISQGKSR